MSKLILLYVLGVPSGFILYLLGFKIGLFSAEDIIFYRGLKILIATLFIQWALFSLVIFYFGKSNINIANALAVTMASFATSRSSSNVRAWTCNRAKVITPSMQAAERPCCITKRLRWRR